MLQIIVPFKMKDIIICELIGPNFLNDDEF